ncbi:hybrid sensor histidine kinase/response regulator [Catenovulum agarivorans]|uniref:response regulator n=1 Tax=Catenovulum agarivorans TaxID=1172192 RepID=UPI00037E4D9F|nr:hybrid sensor histidine kinase/response regulator [Catenovulum agarivorans]
MLCLWLCIRKGIKPLEKRVQLALHGGYLNSETNNKALQKIEYANRLKSELLIRATQALRGGLNGVDGMLALIERQPNEAKMLVQKAKTSSSHMLTIIDGISNYAELTHSKVKVELAPLLLNEFLSELHNNYRQVAEAKDIQFNLSIAPAVPTKLYTDEKVLRNIFEPLIANAVNYTEVGSVQLHLGYVEEDNELVAQIHDSGIGISEAQLKAIKQHNIVKKGFKAADNSIGIGLLIVNRAVELLNAHIEISSRLGQGTNVHITIPLAQRCPDYLPSASQIQMVGKMSYAVISQDPLFIHYYQSVFSCLHANLASYANAAELSLQDNYSVVLVDSSNFDADAQLSQVKGQKIQFNAGLYQAKFPYLPRFVNVEQLLQHLVEKMPIATIRNTWPGKRVLVAEDNEINQEVITSMLENYNLDVQVAANGLVATDTAFKMNFDLIFMDIQMPILDGIEATRKIRESGSQVPIVALTAHTYRTDEKLCFDVGMNGFISKPIQPDKLAKVLARFFN